MTILLVTASFYKAEGSLAKGIAKILSKHNVYFFSIGEIKYRKAEFEQLLDNVDVVHWLFNVAHLDESYKTYLLNAKVPQVATVHHVCAQELNKVDVAAKADLVHVVSTEWKDFVEMHTNTPVHCAHLGINQDNFKEIQSWPSNSGKRIGMMGFYPGKYNRKRADVAIKVFTKLKENGVDFKVLVQGGGWDAYKQDFEKNSIEFKILPTSSGQDIFKFFEKIDVYLCTSDYEGGPLPVLESLQCGIPVVSTNIGVARDALNLGGGVLCPKESVNDLADAIKNLFADGDLFASKCTEAKQVVSKFYWSNLEDQYNQLYIKTVKQWEVNHKANWPNVKPKLEPDKQRNREIEHDKIHEGFNLLKAGHVAKGAKILTPLLASKHIAWSRKKIIAKRLALYTVTGNIA